MVLVDREWPIDLAYPDGTTAKVDLACVADCDLVLTELRIEVLTADGVRICFADKAMLKSLAAAALRGREIVDQFVQKRSVK